MKYHLLVRVATDLLGELRALPPSSRPLGDPLEHDEFPSSPDPELELLLLLLLLLLVYMREESWDPLGDGGNEEPKQGCVKDCRLLLEFSLYMDTGLVRLGEPPHDPMYDITPPSDEKKNTLTKLLPLCCTKQKVREAHREGSWKCSQVFFVLLPKTVSLKCSHKYFCRLHKEFH